MKSRKLLILLIVLVLAGVGGLYFAGAKNGQGALGVVTTIVTGDLKTGSTGDKSTKVLPVPTSPTCVDNYRYVYGWSDVGGFIRTEDFFSKCGDQYKSNNNYEQTCFQLFHGDQSNLARTFPGSTLEIAISRCGAMVPELNVSCSGLTTLVSNLRAQLLSMKDEKLKFRRTNLLESLNKYVVPMCTPGSGYYRPDFQVFPARQK